MKNYRRAVLIAFAPCLLLGLGMLGNGCSDKNSNDAALLAAYQAMLASSTATNTDITSGTTTAFTTATVTTVSTSTAITTPSH